MEKYNNQKFGSALTAKINGKVVVCPVCGGIHFNVPEQMANVIIGDSFEGIQIGQSIPSGMLICNNCGHIEFFALGALGLLPQQTENKTNEK